MNPRIQVEHTVTEEVTDVDLVQSQLRIASGETLADLGLVQDTVSLRGAALQCRITTEDPANNFRPDTGVITTYRSPGGGGVRLDGGTTYTGAEVSAHFDSMLAKLTCRGRDFDEAVQKARRAVAEFRIRGVSTNIAFLQAVLDDPDFAAGGVTTSFIETHPQLLQARAQRRPRHQAADLPRRRHGQPAARRGAGDARPGHQAARPSTSTCPRPTAPASCCWRSGPRSSRAGCARRPTVAVTDTTFRDAHQSLLATRVRTRDLLAVAGHVARTTPELWSLECWGGATYDVALRFLSEDPWERLAALRQAVPNICLQMLLRGRNTVGYTPYPTEVTNAFVEEAAATGIDVFRIFDALNDVEQMRPGDRGGPRHRHDRRRGRALLHRRPLRPRREALHARLLPAARRADRRGRRARARDQGHGRPAARARRPDPGHRAARALRPAGAPAHPRHRRRPARRPCSPRSTPGSTPSTRRLRVDGRHDLAAARCPRWSRPPTTPTARPACRSPRSTRWSPTGRRPGGSTRRSSPGLPSPTGRVYRHEIPGGQLSNLRQQAIALGLGEKFEQIEDMYAAANDILGNIVKVTPSSKVVGDLALRAGRRSAPTRRSSPRTRRGSTSPTR